MKQNIYSVTQVNSYIHQMFAQDFLLKQVKIKGEISNCKYHTSGHIYFTLKDEKAAIAAVMFASSARGLKFRMKDGDQVVVSGSVEVFQRDGKYQIYAREVTKAGTGDLYLEFERRKAMLEEMGMFADEYKKPIPRYASRIGIVTAPTGAAVRDIIQVAKRRNPYVELIVYPALVQGEGSLASVISGIRALDAMHLDVLIVGRGGGSIEDLWTFNEEELAREIFACETPVISAVGHEIDYTIADFVADLRAPTPSAAAELAVFDYLRFQKDRAELQKKLADQFVNQLMLSKEKAEQFRRQLRQLSPKNRLHEKQQYSVQLEKRLEDRMGAILEYKKGCLSILAGRLDGVSPAKKLSQGYAYVSDADGKRVSDVRELQTGQQIMIHFHKGRAQAQVKKIFEDDKWKS